MALLSKLFDCGKRKPDQKAAADPDGPGPVCRFCEIEKSRHANAESLCGLLADAEAERDRLIEAIQNHHANLKRLGLGASPDDLELLAALPDWCKAGAGR